MPKEYVVIFDAVPRSELQPLTCSYRQLSCIFLGKVDITKNKFSNKYIRNCIQAVTPGADRPLGVFREFSLWAA